MHRRKGQGPTTRTPTHKFFERLGGRQGLWGNVVGKSDRVSISVEHQRHVGPLGHAADAEIKGDGEAAKALSSINLSLDQLLPARCPARFAGERHFQIKPLKGAFRLSHQQRRGIHQGNVTQANDPFPLPECSSASSFGDCDHAVIKACAVPCWEIWHNRC